MKEFIDIENGIAVYNTDCVELAKSLPDNSIDFSVYYPLQSSLVFLSGNLIVPCLVFIVVLYAEFYRLAQ